MPRPFSWATEPQPPDDPSQASTSDSITMVSRPHHHEGRPSQAPSLPPPYYHYRHLNRRRSSQGSHNQPGFRPPSEPESSRDPQSFYNPQIFQNPQRSQPPRTYVNHQSAEPPQVFLNPQGFQNFHDISLDEDHRRDTAPGPRYPHPYRDASTAVPRESLDASSNLGPDSSRSDIDLTHGANPTHPDAGQPTTRATPDTEGLTPTQTPPGGDPAANFKPKSLRFWLVMLSNFIAIFLVALDRTIIATAVPRITDDFKSLGDIGWYGSAYMLTTAASQLLFGKVYKFYDVKW